MPPPGQNGQGNDKSQGGLTYPRITRDDDDDSRIITKRTHQGFALPGMTTPDKPRNFNQSQSQSHNDTSDAKIAPLPPTSTATVTTPTPVASMSTVVTPTKPTSALHKDYESGGTKRHSASFFQTFILGIKAFVKSKINAIIKQHLSDAKTLQDEHISITHDDSYLTEASIAPKRGIVITITAPKEVLTEPVKLALGGLSTHLIADFCNAKKLDTSADQQQQISVTVKTEESEAIELNLRTLIKQITMALQTEADRLIGKNECFPALNLFRNNDVARPKAAALEQLIAVVKAQQSMNDVIEIMQKIASRTPDIFAQTPDGTSYTYALLDRRQHEIYDGMMGCFGEKNSTTYDNLLQVFNKVEQFRQRHASQQNQL